MKNDINMQIGSRVRREREKAGYSREELSELIGISSRFLADIELGTKGMSFTTLIKLSDILKISTDYLIIGRSENLKSERLDAMLSQIDDKYIPQLEEIVSAFIRAIAIK